MAAIAQSRLWSGAAQVYPSGHGGRSMQIAGRRIVGATCLVFLLALIWLRPLDTVAEAYTESGLKRAFATFAAARAMNATLSVIQSATVNFQLGAGASLQPGAVLEPLDDLVEQFSALMLAATLSFATQRLLIEIFAAAPVSALLTVLLAAWCVFQFSARSPPGWLPRVALGLLFLRLAVPMAALASEATYRLVLAGKYETSQARIAQAELPEVGAQAGEGLADRLKRWWSQGTDIGKKVEALKARVDDWVEHLVRLAAVFVVQTLLLPLFLLWVMLRFYRALAASFRSG